MLFAKSVADGDIREDLGRRYVHYRRSLLSRVRSEYVTKGGSIPVEHKARLIKNLGPLDPRFREAGLRLNDDEWVELRFEVLNDYLDGEIKIPYLEKRYPFIASEIKRQGIQPR